MTLEDHAGDVVGKARKGLDVAPGQVAEAAGLNDENYARFEEHGTFDELPDLVKIGGLLHLNPDKLATIISGWYPRAADLEANKTVRQITTNEGMEVHCYLVWDAATREAALFDTGWSDEPILALLQENELTLKHLFITHTHHDHVIERELLLHIVVKHAHGFVGREHVLGVGIDGQRIKQTKPLGPDAWQRRQRHQRQRGNHHGPNGQSRTVSGELQPGTLGLFSH